VSGDQAFPKARRLLRTAEYREVYQQGIKIPCSCFVAFCWRSPGSDGPKVGFTTPRALGKSVDRNRMKRRLRDTVRRRLAGFGTDWKIVWNLRRFTLAAPQRLIDEEVEKVLKRCSE
jgi:ribonuclease P protein component